MFMVFDILLILVFNVNYSQCMLMTIFALWLVAPQSICQPSRVLSRNIACASKSLNPKLFQMSPLYLPICSITLLFQVNLHVPPIIIQISICFVCRSCSWNDRGWSVSSMLSGLFSRWVFIHLSLHERGW